MSRDHPHIEICICTFNRVDYLRLCIEALLPQCDTTKVSILVVDNGSTDSTQTYISSLVEQHPVIRYVFEPEPGLSHARNTGWRSSTAKWIFYMDDDCLPPPSFMQAAMQATESPNEFDALGGPIDPIFLEAPPDWLPEGFGQFSLPFQQLTPIEKGFLRGGCFLIRKNILEQLAGFHTGLGVTGNTLRYGEEIELQIRMRQAGMQLGYTPALRIGHHVRGDKLKLRWVLHSEYRRQKDKMVFNPIPIGQATLGILKTIFGRLIWTPVHLFHALTRTSYSYRKALYHIFQPLAYSAGIWIGALKNIFI